MAQSRSTIGSLHEAENTGDEAVQKLDVPLETPDSCMNYKISLCKIESCSRLCAVKGLKLRLNSL